MGLVLYWLSVAYVVKLGMYIMSTMVSSMGMYVGMYGYIVGTVIVGMVDGIDAELSLSDSCSGSELLSC